MFTIWFRTPPPPLLKLVKKIALFLNGVEDVLLEACPLTLAERRLGESPFPLFAPLLDTFHNFRYPFLSPV